MASNDDQPSVFARSSALAALIGLSATGLMSVLGALAARGVATKPVPFPQLLLMGAVGGVFGNVVARAHHAWSKGRSMAASLAVVTGFSILLSGGHLLFRLQALRGSGGGASSPEAQLALWVSVFQTLGLGIGSFASGFAIVLLSPFQKAPSATD